MKIFQKKGQNTAEYAILIALVVAAAIGIKVYVQRGVQARIHDESDALVNKISSADWEISTVAVTKAPQFEPLEFSKKATSDTVEDREVYEMYKEAGKEGTTKKEITKTTTQAAKDYEQYDKPK